MYNIMLNIMYNITFVIDEPAVSGLLQLCQPVYNIIIDAHLEYLIDLQSILVILNERATPAFYECSQF
mgnify:CR=1 FL=1